MAEIITVVAEADFLDRQTKSEPIPALAELIWNSLDGDAQKVDVEFEFQDLAQGLSKIVVYDNGHGFPMDEARQSFGKLGGSFKKFRRQTAVSKRAMHGQEGKGRYKALALGSVAEWKVCYAGPKGGVRAFNITISDEDLKRPVIQEKKISTDRQTGTIVEITNIKKNFKILSSDEGFQELCEIFALYLTNYTEPKVRVDGRALDPNRAIKNRKTIDLGNFPTGIDGQIKLANLSIVEWAQNTKKTLYLCNQDGFALRSIEGKFNNIGNFYFSGYLQHPYIDFLHKENKIELAELDEVIMSIIDTAKLEIKNYFRERAAEESKTIVEEWISEDVYPYKGEPATVIEKVERQVFDIVAVSIQGYAPELSGTNGRAKALHLRLLKNALEKSPSELQFIFNEVLGLSLGKQKELASLLQETSLSAIITAAKTVADRLKFLSALERIVFDPDISKVLKERSQLHKIIAENTWIFGEEYNLWVSDKSLKQVLKLHKHHLDPDIVIDDPVKVEGQKSGIVDLMLSRSVKRHRIDSIEHLVIELKAPSKKIGADEITQIKKYAHAVSGDQRFKTVPGLKWHYWVISNDLTDYAVDEIASGPDKDRRLINKTDHMTVGIKTWAEVIEENRARLQFFQNHLQHNVDDDLAFQYLQERHKEFLEGIGDPRKYSNIENDNVSDDSGAVIEDQSM